MARYRKKPVVVEAVQLTHEYLAERANDYERCTELYEVDGRKLLIAYFASGADVATLEGVMHAKVGDYLITGVKGDKYPCKPDIFKQTYEPAE